MISKILGVTCSQSKGKSNQLIEIVRGAGPLYSADVPLIERISRVTCNGFKPEFEIQRRVASIRIALEIHSLNSPD